MEMTVQAPPHTAPSVVEGPAPGAVEKPKFKDATRVLVSVLSPLEKRTLLWLAVRIPARINSDHLTGLALAAMGAVPLMAASDLPASILSGWDGYTAATERRIATEAGASDRFLVLDFRPDGAAARAAITGGAVVIEQMASRDAKGKVIEVPDALVHHWRGAILLPGVSLDTMFSALKSGIEIKQDDVLQSRVMERGTDQLKMFLRLQRKKIVTAVYNTEHQVTFTRVNKTRASSRSVATKIREISSPGTPSERELEPSDDRGFLWKLNAYWRYEQVPTGVIAECESISLSRDIPLLLRPVAWRVVSSTARESLERTLMSLRRAFAR